MIIILKITAILLFAVIAVLLVALTNNRREYKSVNTTAYYAKLFIIDKGLDEEWQDHITKIGEQEEEQNAKEKN